MLEIYVVLYVWSILLLAVKSSPLSQNDSINERSGRLRIISHSMNPRKELKNESRREVIFPDEFDIAYYSIPKITGEPECADGETYCERIDTYPDQHIKKLLKEDGVPSWYFGKNDEGPVVENRNGGLQSYSLSLCQSLEKTISPKAGKNKNDEWKYIINLKKEGYTQTVRVETCIRKNVECNIIGGLPLGYTTSCEQKYITRTLLALNHVGAPSSDLFKLPSACCCTYKRNFDALARFGDKNANAVTPAKTSKLS